LYVHKQSERDPLHAESTNHLTLRLAIADRRLSCRSEIAGEAMIVWSGAKHA
jgi:hypothetical protein